MKDFIKNLKSSFSIETCHHSYCKKWSKENPTAGHCAIASLVIQEKYGGDLAKVKVGSSTHYFNIIDDKIIDVTSEQFKKQIVYDNYVICDRNKMLKNIDTKSRYEKLLLKIGG